jgi:Ca2+-binding EF-hand superfamily protein
MRYSFFLLFFSIGEKLPEKDVDQLLLGHVDNRGNVRYEAFVRFLMGA